MAKTTQLSPPDPSALTTRLAILAAKHSLEALPVEVLHNLQYQHSWHDLRILPPSRSPLPNLDLNRSRALSPSPNRQPLRKLITGLPPRHAYIHSDLQSHLLQTHPDLSQTSIEALIPIQREYVLPLSLGEKWTLRQFAELFDSLPVREPTTGANGFEWRDAKRVVLAMLAHNGVGGDGTIVYYIMQEGDVKPRQN